MKYLFSFLVLFFSCSVLSQYTGGDADGFTFIDIDSEIELYRGGDSDGFSSLCIQQDNYLYEGGDSDGFSSLYFLQNNYLYEGGDSDGFGQIEFDQIDYFYNGDNQDGFFCINLQGNTTMYRGSDRDGFAFRNIYKKYYWTGTVGTGWNVTANWSNNQIPSLRHSVIIPSGVPNYPAINAGLFTIGKDPLDASSYRCANVLIQSGANMTTRVNCFVELYGVFKIDGTLYVKNPTPNSFKLIDIGLLRVSSGQVIISP